MVADVSRRKDSGVRVKCSCGRWPRFGCYRMGEDAVSSQYTCSGTYGCGKQGPEVEDAYSDEGTAASSWDAMRRLENRGIIA